MTTATRCSQTGRLLSWFDRVSALEQEGLLGGRVPGVLLDVIAFTAAVVLASVLRWDATDLIWGLWASSLYVGYATIVATVIAGVRASEFPRAVSLAGGLGILAFFTFHFGFFHFVHGVFLGGFFPLIEGGSVDPSPFNVFFTPLRMFWPFVLASLVAKLPRIVPKKVSLRGAEGFKAPYRNVVKMHLLIFVFAGLHIAGLTRYAVYPVLAAYFFPWREFVSTFRGGRRS